MLGTLVNIKYESEFGEWVRERERDREEEKVRLTGRKREKSKKTGLASCFDKR